MTDNAKSHARPHKYILLWSNHTDHRDDESEIVWARSLAEAEALKEHSRYRHAGNFSFRGCYKKIDRE